MLLHLLRSGSVHRVLNVLPQLRQLLTPSLLPLPLSLSVYQAYECRSIERQREIVAELYDEGAV